MFRKGWQPGIPGHLLVCVPREQVAEIERVYAIGRRVTLFTDRRRDGWIRVTDLRRTRECAGEVEFLLAFATCYPPAPPN